jgi:hypothetical protein
MNGNLRIRPLRSGEELTIRELFGRMSPRTRYLRFFSEMPVVPDSLVRMLAEVDDHRRLALVADWTRPHYSTSSPGNVAIDEDRAR